MSISQRIVLLDIWLEWNGNSKKSVLLSKTIKNKSMQVTLEKCKKLTSAETTANSPDSKSLMIVGAKFNCICKAINFSSLNMKAWGWEWGAPSPQAYDNLRFSFSIFFHFDIFPFDIFPFRYFSTSIDILFFSTFFFSTFFLSTFFQHTSDRLDNESQIHKRNHQDSWPQ